MTTHKEFWELVEQHKLKDSEMEELVQSLWLRILLEWRSEKTPEYALAALKKFLEERDRND